MPLAAAVFDIGDVHERNPRTGWDERWAGRLGIDREAFWRSTASIWEAGSVGAIDLEEVERRLAGALGLDAHLLDELMADAWTEYLGTLNVELTGYFSSLRSRCRTGILSNSFVGAREREERLYRFSELCDAIVYSHEEGCMKPDPRIYRVVCERLGVAPEATLLLDDRQENVDGAIAVGMQAILFRDNAQAISEIEALLPA